MCKAKEYIQRGKSKTTKYGVPYFEPPKGVKKFGPMHYGSRSEDLSSYILFDDGSIVNTVGDCVLSAQDKDGEFV